MKRAIAIFIIALIATISVPYSRLFSITVHGFALEAPAQPALAGVAWAAESEPVRCGLLDFNDRIICDVRDGDDYCCSESQGQTCNANKKCETGASASTRVEVTGLSITPAAVTGGERARGTVTLSRAGAATVYVVLSSDIAEASVPATLPVPAGSVSYGFDITTTQLPAGSATKRATITARYHTTQTAFLDIRPQTSSGGTGGTGGSGTAGEWTKCTKFRGTDQCVPSSDTSSTNSLVSDGYSCRRGYATDECFEYVFCIRATSTDPGKRSGTLSCELRGCGAYQKYNNELGEWVNVPEGVATLPECTSRLNQVANVLRDNGLRASISGSSLSYAEISSNACQSECQGYNLPGGAKADGGVCSTARPEAKPGLLIAAHPNSRNLCLAQSGSAQATCWCTGIDPATLLQATQPPTVSGLGTSILPGTGPWVPDPAQLQSPSRFPPNDVDCEVPTKVTINATISQNVVPVGATVTVSGDVTKFSDACRGVQYKCREQYQTGCRIEQGFFKTCVVYNSCQLLDPVIYQNGGQCKVNWVQIIGLLLLVAGVFGGVFGSAFGGIGAKITETLKTLFGANYGMFALTLMQQKSQVYVPDGCNSICGRDTGTTPLSAAPSCRGYPIGENLTHYRCRLTSCGGFEGKQVKIEVRNADNKVIVTKSTNTDATGYYSFSFAAPGPAGSYNVVVSTEDPKVDVTIVNTTFTTR